MTKPVGVLSLLFLFSWLACAAEIVVPAGGDFQAALNAANPGDTITLAAGATYLGNFVLPNKPGATFITVRGSAWLSMPPAGVRISPAYASLMPKLVAPENFGAINAYGAHHYRFIGIEMAPAPGLYLDDVVRCSLDTETSVDQLSHDMEFDRVYVHGDPIVGSKRGIGLNCVNMTVMNSYISGFKSTFQDTQALGGFASPGPMSITNNYLEAAEGSVGLGGATANIPGVVPSDIQIRHNYMTKLLSWKQDDPSYAGTPWIVKNHIELKNGQRVTIDGNIMENCWAEHDQAGFSIVLFATSEGGTMPWNVVQDITVTRNIIRHVQGGINLAGNSPSDPVSSKGMGLQRVLVQNNLFDDVYLDPAFPLGQGQLFRVVNGANAITFDHNTSLQAQWLTIFDGDAATGSYVTSNVSFTNAIAPLGNCDARKDNCGFVSRQYQVNGTSLATAPGIPTLNFWTLPGVTTHNAIAGALASVDAPADNFFPATLNDVGFLNLAGHDYHLAPSSAYKNAGTDGKDLGADIDAINADTAGVIQGNPPTTGPCAYSLFPPNATFSPAGGTGSILVSAPMNCPWSASPAPSWLHWTSATSGSGIATVTYSVDPLPNGVVGRAGVLAIANMKSGVTEKH